MIPFLTFPLALAALVSLPLLAGIYLLRNRFRRRTVSSLIFWRLLARVQQGGAKRDRLQLPFIFFIELFILLLLVCAATGPRWQLPSTLRPLVVIMDNSASMLAGPLSDNPRLRAEQALRSLLESRQFRSIRGILAGQSPRLINPAGGPRQSLPELLAAWTCHEAEDSLDRAIVLAKELARGDIEILVLTDRGYDEKGAPGDNLRWWAFGGDLPNLAFASARRTAYDQEDRCLLEVANYSPAEQTASIAIQAGGKVLQQASFQLGAQTSRRLILNVPAEAGPLEATLASDSLAADNQIVLLSPERRKVKTQIAVTHEPLRAAIVEALQASGLFVHDPAHPELVIHQSPKPLLPAGAWDLRLVVDSEGTPYTGPFLVDATHPLARGLRLDGVIWSASPSNAVTGAPIIAAGNVVLVAAAEDFSGQRHLVMRMTPEQSTVANTPNWPVFFYNLLQWRLSESPGLRDNNIRLGTEVEMVTPDPSLLLLDPQGLRKEIPVRSRPILLHPDRAGIYSIATSTATNHLAVNFLSAEESNLDRQVTGRWGQWKDARVIQYEYESVLWIFLLLALLVLTWHLALLARSRAPV